ncbi:MAG: hypothetical protein ACFCA4_13125 [Cyanophyceae cyanobacterium]
MQLIDFSIASLLPKEQKQLVSSNSLEGTLAYIAPEQTGRMNRGIDYRTDFYFLGVTLYELITGTLPFTATDPLELLYCHILPKLRWSLRICGTSGGILIRPWCRRSSNRLLQKKYE